MRDGFESIGRSQLYKDLYFMEASEYKAPIERIQDGQKKIIRYEDPSFSIQNVPLNENEANQLREALMVLNRFQGLPQFEWVQEIIPKIEQSFRLKPQDEEIIGFDSNKYLKGLNFIGSLFNAILYKKVILLEYQSFRSTEPKQYSIHPYYIKQYNNRWFLFGYNPQKEDLTTFSLDRIVSVEESDKEYRINLNYDFSEYFEDIIGITIKKDERLEKIILKFSHDQAPYVSTKPLHGSQKVIEQNENELIISIEVIPNFELEVVVLGFGEHVEILEPEFFKTRIATRIQNMHRLYQN